MAAAATAAVAAWPRRPTVGILLLVAVLIGVSAGQPTSSNNEIFLRNQLKSNRMKWEALGPKTFTLRFTRACFCPPDFRGPFFAEIVDGEVVSARFESGEPADPTDVLTVEEVFNEIESAIDQNAEQVIVKYDTLNGMPTSVFIDISSMIADEEKSYDLAIVEDVPAPTQPIDDDRLVELEAARATWNAVRPESYTMKMTNGCGNCPLDYVGPFIVTVNGDTMTAIEFAEDAPSGQDTLVPDDLVLPTVDGLFVEIQTAIEDGAASVVAAYNPTTGVPENVSIDPVLDLADDEIEYVVELL